MLHRVPSGSKSPSSGCANPGSPAENADRLRDHRRRAVAVDLDTGIVGVQQTMGGASGRLERVQLTIDERDVRDAAGTSDPSSGLVWLDGRPGVTVVRTPDGLISSRCARG